MYLSLFPLRLYSFLSIVISVVLKVYFETTAYEVRFLFCFSYSDFIYDLHKYLNKEAYEVQRR
jgi:hypothetical protein